MSQQRRGSKNAHLAEEATNSLDTSQAPKTSANATKTPKKRTKRHKNRPKRALKHKGTDAPRPGTPAFAKLQATWYARLKAEGFQDLERPDSSGRDRPDWLLHGKSLRSIAETYSPEQAYYYSKLQNFLTHRPQWHASALYRAVAKAYVEGLSYRQICARIKTMGLKHNCNVWDINKIVVKTLVPRSDAWNKSSSKGLEYAADF